MTVTLQHYLVLSVLLFVIGVVGVVVRRNILIVFMSIELMLAAANVALLAFSRWTLILDGEVAAFFVISIMAAEAAVGLALVVAMYKLKGSVFVDDMTLLKG